MSEPVSRRSAFAEKSAEEIARSYLGWFRRLRVCCTAAAVVVGTVAVAGLVVLDSPALYLLGLVALVGIGVYIRWRVNREFRTLVAIINTDCNAEKWRGVISRVREHDARRRRARSLCDCYLALADLEELRPADALARMAGLASLAALRELVAGYRAGSKKRELAERQLADLELSLKPREAWDAEDEARARERVEAAPTHRERVSWALLLADRELLVGDAAAARRLLDRAALLAQLP